MKECLFSTKLQIKGTPTRQKLDTRTIQLDFYLINTSTLEINLTDQDDLYFFYSKQLTSTEYHELKKEQNFVVSFKEFPFKLMELVKKCRNCSDPNGNLFEAEFSWSDNIGWLKVVENNGFKQIVHIALQFSPASSETLRQHFCDIIQNLRNQNESLLRKTSDRETLQQILDTKIEEIRKLEKEKNELNSQITSLLGSKEEVKQGKTLLTSLEKEMNGLRESARQSEEEKQQKDFEIDRLRQLAADESKKIQELERKDQEKSILVKNLEGTIRTLNKRLEENKNIMESNERVMDWLHKQVNEGSKLPKPNPKLFTTENERKPFVRSYRQGSNSTMIWPDFKSPESPPA